MTALLVLLKVVHVLAAAVAVGTNSSAVFWLRAGGRDAERIAFAIDGIRKLDKKVAIPAFAVLLLTGFLMVAFGLYDFTRGWIILAIVLYVALAIAGMRWMGPALKRTMAEAQRDPASEAYDQAARTSLRYTLASLGVLVVIVTLMVTKPF
jgi:uncharacterized membrane protein